MVYNYNVFANKTSLRAWRNGRRACLRGMFERVWVQVPPPAPPNRSNPIFLLRWDCKTFVLPDASHQRTHTPCGLNATNSKIKFLFLFAFNIAFAPRASDKQVPPPAPLKLRQPQFFYTKKRGL